jgi:hypothetical protein
MKDSRRDEKNDDTAAHNVADRPTQKAAAPTGTHRQKALALAVMPSTP